MNGLTITQEDWDAVSNERNDPTPPETPPAEDHAPETPETPADPAPAEPKPALDLDVQAKLQRLDELSAAMPQLVNELREAKGRIGALQSQWDKARQQTVQPTQAQVAAAAKDPEKWESLKKDFPEWGEAISDFVENKLSGLAAKGQGPSQEEIEQLVAQRAEATTAELTKKFNERIVTAAHRTWRNDVKTEDFAAWFKTQDARVQALAGSPEPEDAIEMLDLYAEHRKKSAPAVRDERAKRLEAAASPRKPGSPAPVSKAFEDMDPKEQWEYMAKQREKDRSSA